MKRDLPDLSALAVPGAVFLIRATPKASRDRIEPGTPLRIHVTAPADKGAANAAILALMAEALGVSKSRLTLIRGATGRDKAIRLD
ncbi:DUF167 domain-containing protein [Roseicyclus persicicus]|uniref:UPF0235 protein HCU73_06340 n=1 Tax=Roseicyclus persicicus TaxID=2650661 RepID=A0A7X6JY90_9RHOB|nr:DUF167 domain-containing protein [Roseibacterium persicicum]NKX44204.1 DUF167 domain-containing protein [Roseibacterium persicicum]